MTTRDELRAKAIEAMAVAMAASDGFSTWEEATLVTRRKYYHNATAAFDALHGIVRVVPVEATAEMIDAIADDEAGAVDQYINMSSAGDLTDEPKK